MAAVIRLKRKACDEPAEGLLIAVKKSKHESSDKNKVLFKFAATLNSENESVREQIRAALARETSKKNTKWRDPKDIALSQSTVKKLTDKIKSEHKDSIAKKKLDLLNNRRLIVSEEFQNPEDDPVKDAEVRQLFHLYDIIEENEEVKKQNDETEAVITCNNVPLVREKVDDYVFDVYIANQEIDNSFLDRAVSVMPCSITEDDIYFGGDTDDSDECYEDEDDSNDENNWRNDYPEDADDPVSEKGSNSDSENSDESYEDHDDDPDRVESIFSKLAVADEDDCDDLENNSFDYSRIMKELCEEYSED